MKALFVGLGSIGQRHLRNLKILLPDVEILAFRKSRNVPVLDDRGVPIENYNLAKHYNLKEYFSLKEEKLANGLIKICKILSCLWMTLTLGWLSICMQRIDLKEALVPPIIILFRALTI